MIILLIASLVGAGIVSPSVRAAVTRYSPIGSPSPATIAGAMLLGAFAMAGNSTRVPRPLHLLQPARVRGL
jgi:hypothetical protein